MNLRHNTQFFSSNTLYLNIFWKCSLRGGAVYWPTDIKNKWQRSNGDFKLGVSKTNSDQFCWRLNLLTFDHSICVFGPKATVKHSTDLSLYNLLHRARGQDLALVCVVLCVWRSMWLCLVSIYIMCILCISIWI